MATKEFRSNFKVSELLAPILLTSDQNSSALDMQGYESALLIVQYGVETDTLSGSVYSQCELEDSPDNSTWTNCAAADMVGAADSGAGGLWNTVNVAADANKTYSVGYVGDKRYVRCVINLTGSHSTGLITGIAAVQGHARAKPVTQETTNADA